MRGKILGAGVISADDGNRYKFEEKAIQNLENQEIDKLVNADVDFVINDGKADEIFILNTPKQSTTLTEKIGNDDVQGVKTKMFIGLGLRLGAAIPYIGLLLSIASFVFQFLGLSSAKKLSNSQTIVKNFTISYIVGFVASIVTTIGLAGVGISAMMSQNCSYSASFGRYCRDSGLSGSVLLLLVVVVIVCAVASIIFMHKYFKELSVITEQSSFMTVFWLYAIGTATAIIFIGVIFFIIGIILEFVAWSKVDKIKETSN